ncbi:MAG: DUF357 domain-containing protein [Methanoregulaceae archaeon]|nr:DUF357 domain-containing protein [Methanoregulaceae archaeon]
MRTLQLKTELEARFNGADVLPASRTAFSGCAKEVLGMMDAYLRDGDDFHRRGDHPNALASFAYALGWSDAATCLGLIRTPRMGFPLPSGDLEHVGEGEYRFEEKTRKYDYHLGTAMAHLRPAAEEGSCLYGSAERFLLVARVFYGHGHQCQQNGDFSGALASYSYGSGWLDAGVRTGLFSISGRRELFTI